MKMYYCKIDYGYGDAKFYTPYSVLAFNGEYDYKAVEKRFRLLASTIYGMKVSKFHIYAQGIDEDQKYEMIETKSFTYLWREDGARRLIKPYWKAIDGWNTYYCNICNIDKFIEQYYKGESRCKM